MYNEERYTNLFKRKLIINIMTSLSGIILLVITPFIKFFQLCLTNGFEVFPEPILVLQTYSLYDFLKADSETKTFLILASIGFFLLLAILIGLIVKYIINICNIKKYSFEYYDIKKNNQTGILKFRSKSLITGNLIGISLAILFFPTAMICGQIATSFIEANFDSIYYINSINASIIAIGVFIVITFGLACTSSIIDYIIKNKILKEKYDTIVNDIKEN